MLDEKICINTEEKISQNLIEKIVSVVPVTDSYRKTEEVMRETTNTDLIFETIRKVIVIEGNKIAEKNKEKCEKENKEFNPKLKVKTELKLHVMYEEWKK